VLRLTLLFYKQQGYPPVPPAKVNVKENNQSKPYFLREFFSFKTLRLCRCNGISTLIIHCLNFFLSSCFFINCFDINPIRRILLFCQITSTCRLLYKDSTQFGRPLRWQYRINIISSIICSMLSKWKQVHFVGHHRIRRDGCRITVYEYNLNSFFTKAAGGLKFWNNRIRRSFPM